MGKTWGPASLAGIFLTNTYLVLTHGRCGSERFTVTLRTSPKGPMREGLLLPPFTKEQTEEI